MVGSEERIRSAVARVVSHRQRAAVITDFDGTLAPIVDDPSESAPLPGVTETLAELSRRFAVTAVVSGRPVSFLQARLGFAGAGGEEAGGAREPLGGLFIVGLYGMERIVPGGASSVLPAADKWRGVVARAHERALACAPAGLRVENKGLALTLHWREAPQTEPFAVSFAREEASASGLEVAQGKMSVELRPPHSGDKGTVVSELCASLEAACYLGDDRGDLPAFEALDRLSNDHLLALKVAVSSREVPPELLANADVVVDGPRGALGVLAALAEQ